MIAIPVNPIKTTNVIKVFNASGKQIAPTTFVNSTDEAELNLKTNFFIDLGLYYKF